MTTDTQDLPLIAGGEACRRLGVVYATLRKMAERGEVESLTLPSGHRRYRQTGILAPAQASENPPP